jgi:hypothetical protein
MQLGFLESGQVRCILKSVEKKLKFCSFLNITNHSFSGILLINKTFLSKFEKEFRDNPNSFAKNLQLYLEILCGGYLILIRIYSTGFFGSFS